jgi:hypothetical protein
VLGTADREQLGDAEDRLDALAERLRPCADHLVAEIRRPTVAS